MLIDITDDMTAEEAEEVLQDHIDSISDTLDAAIANGADEEIIKAHEEDLNNAVNRLTEFRGY